MNKGDPSANAGLLSPNSGVVVRSNQMLSELLALNEEMIVQLRVERTEAAGRTDFITGMIAQHENVAAKLRAQLRNLQAATALGKALIPQPVNS